MGEAQVRLGRVEETLDLRQRVLRPHQRPADLLFPGDRERDTAHFLAVAAGRVVGVGSVMREEPPPGLPSPETGGAWRIRGMATEPEWRGRGVGGRVLAAAIDHVRVHGGGLLWCNARVPAQTLYEREGLRATGPGWDAPGIGPHRRMWRLVEPAGRAEPPA